jgi:hypothetical protein
VPSSERSRRTHYMCTRAPLRGGDPDCVVWDGPVLTILAARHPQLGVCNAARRSG